MRRVGVAERRARLMRRHGLVERLDHVVDAAESMVALHSSDPATVFLSCWARVANFRRSDLEESLYVDKELVRVLGMRRTMWVIPTDVAPLVQSSSTNALIEPQRRRLIKMLEESSITDNGESWLASVTKDTLQALGHLGEATARELTEAVPALATKITAYKGDGTIAGQFGASTRVLFQLATEGRVVRARPLGSWLSSQYRWSTTENWLQGGFREVEPAEAENEIIRKWLMTFGPGSETDVKWWTGWPVTRVRKALERVDAVEVSLDAGHGYLHPDDVEEPELGQVNIALLPSLDPTTMGWKQRDWYLGDLGSRLFDRNGNAGPTIWENGRIIGGWTQQPQGTIAHEILEAVGTETRDKVEECVAELEKWLGDHNVTARFRSPHDKELAES